MSSRLFDAKPLSKAMVPSSITPHETNFNEKILQLTSFHWQNWILTKLHLKLTFIVLPHYCLGCVFTKRTDVLPQDLVKTRSREIGCYNDHIALKFDRHLGSAAAEVPVEFQSDWNRQKNPNLVASRLHEILRWDVRPLSKQRPGGEMS